MHPDNTFGLSQSQVTAVSSPRRFRRHSLGRTRNVSGLKGSVLGNILSMVLKEDVGMNVLSMYPRLRMSTIPPIWWSIPIRMEARGRHAVVHPSLLIGSMALVAMSPITLRSIAMERQS